LWILLKVDFTPTHNPLWPPRLNQVTKLQQKSSKVETPHGPPIHPVTNPPTPPSQPVTTTPPKKISRQISTLFHFRSHKLNSNSLSFNSEFHFTVISNSRLFLSLSLSSVHGYRAPSLVATLFYFLFFFLFFSFFLGLEGVASLCFCSLFHLRRSMNVLVTEFRTVT
jgi:hypothetical protein